VLTEHDIYLFREGTHARLYETLGCHLLPEGEGARFAVWAPNAREVSVVGDWNGWSAGADRLAPRPDGSGIWVGEAPRARRGQTYKYRIVSNAGGHTADKADPFAFFAEVPPATGSRAWSLDYDWGDAEWMARRRAANALDAPVSIYEVHAGSWRRAERGGFLGYRELARELAEYVRRMGFTHVELLPVMEHPFYGSWGYQCTGYFAPTARHGTPQDLMYLIDHLHANGIGVILDWVPSHFPSDAHGLAFFDGTYLYEHADPRQGFHPEWNSSIFNYGRHEVRAFLLSSALFWLDKYHADGLRVDAVASMLYLDYSRKEGEWMANQYGGRENLEAIEFLRQFNAEVYRSFPDVQTIAEESTAWPAVSRPTYVGGLGFGLKWDMGWMHDTLKYIAHDPIHRMYHHNQLTFRMLYAFTENFLLPLSHDEVVHGKRALLSKMPGDMWQQLANLRLLFGYMFTQPGKKLLFMGGEFGQWNEWNHDASLDWNLLNYRTHTGIQEWVSDLNKLYRNEPALHELDERWEGFDWIDANDVQHSVYTYLRKGKGDDMVMVACNCTPVVRHEYRVGVPRPGYWQEVLNSDARTYGGSGVGNLGGVQAADDPCHGRPHSLHITLPPLATVIFKAPKTG
jgi:1,4-alpha-glucan branching enzyme